MPAPATFAVFALGCQQNWYDAERVAHALSSAGLLATVLDDADLIVLLSCSVRQKAADRLYGLIDKWRAAKQRQIVVSACVLPSDQARLAKLADAVVPDSELLAHLETIVGRPLPAGDRNGSVSGTNVTHPSAHAFIPITAGCNNFCTYCAVPLTRGRERSRPAADIIREAESALKQGRSYLTLLGQNVNSYGLSDYTPRDLRKSRDRSGRRWSAAHPSPFVELLAQLAALPGLQSLAFLSPNPQDVADDLIAWMRETPVFSRTLHLPLQSGSDRILRQMNRRYSKTDYLELVDRIRQAVPDLLLSTDIIVGFPGETDDDWQQTLDVVRQAAFCKVFIGIYSPRPGTVAANLYKDDVPATIKQARWKELDAMVNHSFSDLNPATGDRSPGE